MESGGEEIVRIKVVERSLGGGGGGESVWIKEVERRRGEERVSG